jgi:hypothetical protein
MAQHVTLEHDKAVEKIKVSKMLCLTILRRGIFTGCIHTCAAHGKGGFSHWSQDFACIYGGKVQELV